MSLSSGSLYSIDMSSNESSKLASAVPMFPDRVEEFDNWCFVMSAMLDAQGLWHVVESPIDAKSSSSSSSTPAKKTDVEKSKEAYAILARSFGSKQIALVKQLPRGDAHAVWKKLVATYGVVRSTESKVSMLGQLSNLKKSNTETIENYIARADKLVADLKCVDETISVDQRKYHILEGLQGLDEWKLDVLLMRKSEHETAWTQEKFDQYLISQENSRRMKAATVRANKIEENAHFNNDNGKHKRFGGRGGYNRGRGSSRGRGGFRANDNQNNANNENKNNENRNGANNRGNHRGSYNGGNNNQHRPHNGGANVGNVGQRDRSSITCYNCGKTGHIQRDCWAPKRDNAMHAQGDAGADSKNEEYSFMVREKEVHKQHIDHASIHVDSSFHAHVAMSERVLDTGATRHFTCDRSVLFDTEILSSPGIVESTNGRSSFSVVGKVNLIINNVSYMLNDVAYVKDFKTNLISVSRMTERGFTVMYDDKEAVIRRKSTEKVMFTIPKRGKLYIYSADRTYTADDNEQSSNNDGPIDDDSNQSNNEEADDGGRGGSMRSRNSAMPASSSSSSSISNVGDGSR